MLTSGEIVRSQSVLVTWHVTSELKKLIRRRDYLRAKANKTGSEYIRQAFNPLRSKVSYELNQAEKNYYTHKIEQHGDN